MRIHTKIVLQLTDSGFALLEDTWIDYEGPIAQAGGGSGKQTVTQKTDPPAYLLPYLQEMLQGAQKAYRGASDPTTDPTLNTSTQWLNQAAQQARETIPGQQASYADFMKNVQDVGNNPYLQGATKAAIRPLDEQFSQSIMPAIRSGATSAGQTGSTRQGIAEGLATQGLQRASGDISTNMYNKAFQQGQGIFLSGLGMAPQINAMSEYPISLLNKQYEMEASLPYENVNRFSSLLQGLPGSNSSTTGPGAYRSPALSALGGAASGASIGASFGASGGPIGAGIGAIIGLLAS